MGGLLLEFVPHGKKEGDALLQDLPLGGSRNGRSKVALKLSETMMGEADSEATERNHTYGGFVEFGPLSFLWSARGVDHLARAAPQALAVPAGCNQKGLSGDP